MADLDLDDDARRRRLTSPGYQPPGDVKPGPYTPTPAPPVGSWNVHQPPPQNPTPSGPSAPTLASSNADDIRRALEGVSRGIRVEQDDITDVQRLNQGDTIESRIQDVAARFARRAVPTEGRQSDSQGAGFNQQTNQATPGFRLPNTNQFRDPVTGPVADFANQLSNRFANPPAGSGNQLLEDALRRLSAQFEGGGFTPAEQETLTTQAIEPLERLRHARRQQVVQHLSQRNIDPNSGVGRAMLMDVDRQFDTMRASQQTQLGAQAANERRQRMTQSLEMLSGLAGNEQNRLGTAYQYATVPVGLADRAFNQSMQLYGQVNPAALINPAMQMAQLGQGQNANFGNALAQIAWFLMNGRN